MRDLIAKLRADPGNQKHWAAWYERTYPRVFYPAYRFARGNREAARDLVQEAFARFLGYHAIERVTSEAHALSFLIKTCRNLAIDRQGENREVSLEQVPEIDVTPVSDDSSVAEFDLRKTLERLDRESRQLIAWIAEGRSVASIAEQLRLSYTATGVRLHRIRRRLQKSLEAL